MKMFLVCEPTVRRRDLGTPFTKRPDERKAANDNGPRDDLNFGGEAAAPERLDGIVLSIARLIGRQMAREDFAARIAANDNRSRSAVDDDG